jgi:hypothetical protein
MVKYEPTISLEDCGKFSKCAKLLFYEKLGSNKSLTPP